MNELGLITDSHTVSFDCALPGDSDWVWWHMTEQEGLRAWLAEGSIEPRVGGSVKLRFQKDEALVRTNCGVLVQGVVSCFEPRRRLAYSWVDASREGGVFRNVSTPMDTSCVSFNLTGGQGRTLLSLTHTGLSASALTKVGAGWHAHLALLANVLSEDIDDRVDAGYRTPFAHRGTYTGSLTAGMNI